MNSCSLEPVQPDFAERAGIILAGMEPWQTLGYSPQSLTRYLLREDPALYRFTVSVSSGPVGLICIRYPWLLGPCIELIALFASHQSKGIGRNMVEWIEAQAPSSSRNLWSVVSSFNMSARRFYEGMGFHEVVPITDLVSVGYTEILMRKHLKTLGIHNH